METLTFSEKLGRACFTLLILLVVSFGLAFGVSYAAYRFGGL
jgi:hypothetical protein